MGQYKHLKKLFEHGGFAIYQTKTKRKIKTLTKPLFKKTPKELCVEQKNIPEFVEQNIELMTLLLSTDGKAYFFFDRGDGKIFTQIHSRPLGPHSSYGNLSVHQMSWSNNFVPGGTLLFIPIIK